MKIFSKSLRMSLAPYEIAVSCLFPGGTRTRVVEASAMVNQLRARR
jgi:short-subunit dehydrogenase